MTRQGILNAMQEHLMTARARLAAPDNTIGHPLDGDINAPMGLAHLDDMLRRAAPNGPNQFSDGKLNRWLGYVQGVLVARQIISLDEAKDCSRRHKAD